MKSIKDILDKQQTITVSPNTSVADAARSMAAHQIGAVPVLDGEQLVGIFTERDALTRVVAANLDPSKTMVADVMSTNLVAADVNESYETCLDRMRQAHIRHLVALQDGRMAGIVSMRDLMALDLNEKGEEITLLNQYVNSSR